MYHVSVVVVGVQHSDGTTLPLSFVINQDLEMKCQDSDKTLICLILFIYWRRIIEAKTCLLESQRMGVFLL